MSKHADKSMRPLAGHFIGWGDDRVPYRYIKLATTEGELTAKVAKNLRSQIQEWQPGIWVNVMTQVRVKFDGDGARLKVIHLIGSVDPSNLVAKPVPDSKAAPSIDMTEIRVCQGSSCRRRGSEQIAQAIAVELGERQLADRVEVKSVKCMDRCKLAPNITIVSPDEGIVPGKKHYHKLQLERVKSILDQHFPTVDAALSIDERTS